MLFCAFMNYFYLDYISVKVKYSCRWCRHISGASLLENCTSASKWHLTWPPSAFSHISLFSTLCSSLSTPSFFCTLCPFHHSSLIRPTPVPRTFSSQEGKSKCMVERRGEVGPALPNSISEKLQLRGAPSEGKRRPAFTASWAPQRLRRYLWTMMSHAPNAQRSTHVFVVTHVLTWPVISASFGYVCLFGPRSNGGSTNRHSKRSAAGRGTMNYTSDLSLCIRQKKGEQGGGRSWNCSSGS